MEDGQVQRYCVKGELAEVQYCCSIAVLVLHLRNVRLSILNVSESYHTCASYDYCTCYRQLSRYVRAAFFSFLETAK